MKLREFVLFGILAVLLGSLGLTGCGAAPESSSPAPVPVPGPASPAQLAAVTLKVGDQKGTSQRMLLEASGQLKDLPYKIEWSTFTSGPPMLEAANAGAIDVGQVGNTPPIFSAAAGGNITVVGALRSTVGDALLVPKNSTLARPSDLRGKTIAVAKGSSANGTLLNTLEAVGLKPGDVTISYLQPSDAYSAFTQGSVAAWAVWEPYNSEAVQNLGARELISGADALRGTGPAGGKPLSNGLALLVANRTVLADAAHNAAIGDYLKRVGRANQWASAHPDQWAALYGKATGLSPSVAASAAPRLALAPAVLDDPVVASEQKLADAFTAAGLVPGRVNIADYIDRRYNRAVTGGGQ